MAMAEQKSDCACGSSLHWSIIGLREFNIEDGFGDLREMVVALKHSQCTRLHIHLLFEILGFRLRALA